MGRETAIREYVTLGYQDNKHRIMLFLRYSFRRIISNRGEYTHCLKFKISVHLRHVYFFFSRRSHLSI